MRRTRLEGQAQGLAGPQQVRLADHLVEALRPQQFGQRGVGGGGEEVGHGTNYPRIQGLVVPFGSQQNAPMTSTQFRALLLFSVATGLASAFIDALFPALIPEALSAAWEKEPPFDPEVETFWLLVALLVPWLLASVVSTVGLFFYWRWARPLALIVAVLGLAVSPLLGPGLASGWSSALLEASFLSWGAVLALAYWSPIGQRFERQPNRPALAK